VGKDLLNPNDYVYTGYYKGWKIEEAVRGVVVPYRAYVGGSTKVIYSYSIEDIKALIRARLKKGKRK